MKSITKNYYQILGLPWNASTEDIRKAYRMYAAKFHPDKHAGDPFFEERFKEVKEAFDVLSDPDVRWKYDIKKFGRSKVVRTANPEYFDRPNGNQFHKKGKFRVDISHLDLYIACFYFINIASWVILKRWNESALPEAHIWGLFVCALSSMLIWLFANGVTEWRNGRYKGPRILLFVYLVLGLALGYLTLWWPW